METMNQIAQGFGYIIITFMVLFGLFLWRMMKKAPNYDDMEENRFMGLQDMVETLEKEKALWLLDKEALEMEIDRQESRNRLLEKANEDLKGETLLATAKKAEAEINLATANIQVKGMKITLGTAYDQHAALLTKHEQLKKENETLKQDNKITVEALFQKEADITTARKRASLFTARLTDLLAKEDYDAILALANNMETVL